MSLRDININLPLNVLLGETKTTTALTTTKKKQQHQRQGSDSTDNENEVCFDYLYLGNIPIDFKSADLRFFFSNVIEKEVFSCFHYRHRPETQIVGSDVIEQLSDTSNDTASKSCCCIIKCHKKSSISTIQKYNGKEWRSSALIFTKTRVNMRLLKLSSSKRDQVFKTNRELIIDRHDSDQELSLQDIEGLLEMNPPTDVMPNGNVGTPTKHFQKMISECRLPCSVIKRLGIVFSKHGKSRQYSSVQLEYKSNSNDFQNPVSDVDDDDKQACSSKEEKESNNRDNDAEEWDRYEALHDDVDNQARPKERLFEEDLEVKWEKGGSGLVFYTDAYFWNEMKGKDFDEDTVDDWDVDYSVYYEDGMYCT